MNKFDKAYHSVISEMNEQIMKQLGFSQQVNDVHNGICPFCKTPINMNDFRDQLSRKEYKISGLCQKCQDQVFSSEDDEQENQKNIDNLRQIIINKVNHDQGFKRTFASAVADESSEKGLFEVFKLMSQIHHVSSRGELINCINRGEFELQDQFGEIAATNLPNEDLEKVLNANPQLLEDQPLDAEYKFYSPNQH